MIGRILDNRYEIIEEIGSGGMAQVYKARCALLNRFVAIKVLRPEFARDDDFLARFKTEAQAAAALSYQNIVSIYDVGREDDIEYIVMEYVEGITLKEYIKRNKLLSWQETVDFAVQICRALKCAHKNGIIHRDIKPQNIILTPESVLKVTDFGIARAVSSSSITITASTMGSVHYLSPEQAKGGYTDAKSDIYSLGIVMYEMVTGRLPFDGDSPVSIAIKQIQETPIPPKEYNVAVPLALERIILKAMSKEQSQRYQTADDMLIDLEIARVNPEAPLEYETPQDESPTKKIPVIDTAGISNIQDEKPKAVRPVKQNVSAKKNDKRTVVWAIVTSVLIVSALVVGAINVLYPGSGGDVEVPDLLGAVYEEVKDSYKAQNISITLAQTTESAEYAEGEIMQQNPKSGKKMKPPFEILVTVSSGVKQYKLENYEKKGAIEVKIALESHGLVVLEEKEESETITEGMVIRTSPAAGSVVKAGDKVTLYVSSGLVDKKVQMPNIVGLSLQQAKIILSDNNLLEGGITEEYSDKPVGQVLSQGIDANSQTAVYSKVNMVISKGVQPRTRPVTITVPQTKDATAVKIVQDGKIIHNAVHNKEEKAFNVTVSGEGTVTVEVYYDGEFARSLAVSL